MGNEGIERGSKPSIRRCSTHPSTQIFCNPQQSILCFTFRKCTEMSASLFDELLRCLFGILNCTCLLIELKNPPHLGSCVGNTRLIQDAEQPTPLRAGSVLNRMDDKQRSFPFQD